MKHHSSVAVCAGIMSVAVILPVLASVQPAFVHRFLAMTTAAQAAGCPERPRCRGCGCAGGPGYRSRATGQFVGYKALTRECGDPPTLRCTFENAPGTGRNRDCALGLLPAERSWLDGR